MATITLEVPDELAEQLQAWGEELPNVLAALVGEENLPSPSPAWQDHEAWLEALDFLAGTPDIQAIADFKLSAHLQDRLEELLDANSEGTLTSQEERELDGFIQIIRFFNLLKVSLRTTFH